MHTGLRNGHGDMLSHSVLNSLDNKPPDEKYVSSQASANHSKSQQDFVCGDDLYHGVGSVDLNKSKQAYAHVRERIPPSSVHANPVMAGKKHAGKHEFDVSEEQARKKEKRLQHLQGSRKSSKFHRICLTLYVIAA